ncbi:MAG: Mur ligase family protein, partial [Polyangiaceae bacterium]
MLGLGISGAAAARLCLSRGAKVTGADAKKEAELASEVKAMTAGGLVLAAGGHAEAALESADLVVMSPGVPSFPALEKAEKKGVPVIGEVELACQCLPRDVPVIAIGGTNGKSTTTTLVADLLETNGRRVFRGGNLGEPLALHVDEAWDVIVLEVSSFQMERLQHFRPRASILLNVTADHLDRYPSFEAYADAKGNAFVRQSAEDIAIVPVGDEICLRQAKRGQGRVMTFGPGGDIDVTHA